MNFRRGLIILLGIGKGINLPDGKSVYDYSNQDVFYAEVLGVKFVERERKNYYQLTLREPELSEWQKKLMECELLKKSPLNKF